MFERSVRVCLVLVGACAFAVGCGGGKSAEEKQLDQLRDELVSVQKTSDKFEDRLDKLEVDQAEKPGDMPKNMSSVAPPARSLSAPPMATPPLRVVRIGADGTEESSASGETAGAGGDDPKDTTPRPVIRIQGSGSEATVTENGKRVRKGGGTHVDRIEQTMPPEVPANDSRGAASGARPSALDENARRSYDAALSLVGSKRYAEALDAFAGFLVRWPDHPNADNAMFWRGECYFAEGEFVRAADQFEGVLARFPIGNKVPDALLKLGIARQKLGDPQAAQRAFERLRRDYPHSDAAPARRDADQIRWRAPPGRGPAHLRGESMIRRSASAFATLAFAWASLAAPPPALAQQGVQTAPPGGPGAQGGGGTTTVTPVFYPGGVAPPTNGQPLGGGNATESSSRTIAGDGEDSFDLGPKSGAGGGTVHGDANGAIFYDKDGAPEQRPLGPTPAVHVVRKGDTLWDICDTYFKNPYQWPRIWSYNAQIQNPHWIYPNEQVRLKAGAALGAVAGPGTAMPMNEAGVAIRPGGAVPPGTIFLRDQGFVNDDASLNWGSIVGAPEDKMFLSDTDQVYVRVGPDHDVKLGEELTVFRPIRQVGDGQVIAIQGTLRVDEWNPGTRVARAQVVETLDAIERGARVGPITRRFEVVPPRRNTVDVTTHIAIAVVPHVFYGQNQLVFIDKGSEAGLQPGNRLFVIRHGDSWRQSMASDQPARRIASERNEPAVMENTPKLRDDSALPEEVVGELRVLDVQKKSATCLLTRTRSEIEINDLAVARKGY
jgi:tol-pal system protein YbgF